MNERTGSVEGVLLTISVLTLFIYAIVFMPAMKQEYAKSVAQKEAMRTPLSDCKYDCTIVGWDSHIDYSCVEKCLAIKKG